ncbi:hypothetical protein [Qipengyuania sp. JC766]|uniref:hypothetical protein n=1 Tax=Qipengyuania sp. JC766 TaxID=3232139 RepID=UPI0034592E45
MIRALLVSAGAIALTSSLVVAGENPESLLPDVYSSPRPSPTPTPRPTATTPPASPAPSTTQAPSPSGPSSAPAPSTPAPSAPAPSAGGSGSLPALERLNRLSDEELDELLGIRPQYDIPPAARRSLARAGVIATTEGGLPPGSLVRQPASIVRAALSGVDEPLVSRWGHILARRAYASRMAAPEGMDPAEFAALRVQALNRIGEFGVARALAQDVDTANWNAGLTNAAAQAYIATADITGICPALELQGSARDGEQGTLLRAICQAYSGQGSRAFANLDRALRGDEIADIDVLLAQRFAGAAGQSRRTAQIEWDGVEEITPLRFALASAVGVDVPEDLRSSDDPYFERVAATNALLDLDRRAGAADRAAREGILSADAMVDLYSRIYAEEGGDGALRRTASRLRDAYTADSSAARVEAIREVWDGTDRDYGRMVLTAYAAARVEPSEELLEAAPDLIASMLTAGLERDAMRWADFVPQGSLAWGQLVFAQPVRENPVTSSQFSTFRDADQSEGARKSKFLLAGLAGLGRIDQGLANSLSEDLGAGLGRETRWSQLISRSAEVNNPALVAYLAALGMQGGDWSEMTPRHLYHIVSALNRVGLSAEARMIAAEAVARG